MAWWNKVVSAAKAVVNKAVAVVNKVVETIKKTVSDTVKKAASSVSSIANTVKKNISSEIKKAEEKVKVVKKTIKKTVSESVSKADDKVKAIQNTVVETLWEEQKEVKEKIDEAKAAAVEVVQEKIKEVKKATWPNMPVYLPEKLKPYWRRMETAYINDDKGAMLQVLRELRTKPASPMPALALILGIVGIVGLVVTLIGSYTFAGFIREEALQTTDFAIKMATENKDLEGLEKAIAFKKELLERTLWEKIGGAIPIYTLRKELGDYYKAAAVKLEIDENVFEKLKTEMTGAGMPEKVRVMVRDIIDGDTIDVALNAKDAATGEEIKLPEYLKTSHARIRIVGINAPEKSPKGEILCSDVEIYKVEKEFADKSRDRLMPLNDKEVILKIDPEIIVDTYNRILAVVEYNGVDIGLRQIKEGLACGYYREPHKYYNEEFYRSETLAAKDAGIGMWKGLEEVEKEEEKIKIKINSIPTNAKLFLDDVTLHHNTPTDEIELSDVLYLFTLGKHVISAEKGGLSAMEDIEIKKGDNGVIKLILEAAPIPAVPTEEEKEEEKEEEEKEEEKEEEEIIIEPVKIGEIPTTYTIEQAWALKEAFTKILDLTEGTKIMSEKERADLISSFAMYTDGQKIVLNLLWRDLIYYTQGREQLSADEYAELYDKYRMAV